MNRFTSIPDISATVSHNEIGQKLGRKGLETRERILAAMLRLLADENGPPVTLTSVANEASIRLTNLYLYFPDAGALLLAALGRVMDSAEAAFVDKLREHWPDETLQQSCLSFLTAHYDFWKRNARLLHMRNALADAGDMRVLRYRYLATLPLIDLLASQMECPPEEGGGPCTDVATVVLTGLERVATVATNPQFIIIVEDGERMDAGSHVRALIAAEAEVIALAVAHRRSLHRSRG